MKVDAIVFCVSKERKVGIYIVFDMNKLGGYGRKNGGVGMCIIHVKKIIINV